MTPGYKRFDHFLSQLESLMQDAALTDNPALHLYSNDARSILFRLEALGRIYAEIHNANRFSKLTARFKLLEDLLGDIDHYDTFLKASRDKNNDDSAYFNERMQEGIISLNRLLDDDGWLSGKRSRKIRKKLEDADWKSPEAESRKVREVYSDEIIKIRKFYNDCSKPFTDIEEEVHELRRDLRWLSIYPHALLDLFILKDDPVAVSDPTIETGPELRNSPFLVLPETDTSYPIHINKENFVLLSWIIGRLGDLKDVALAIFAEKEAKEGNVPTAFILAPGEKDHDKLSGILGEATTACERYFSGRSLENLLCKW